MDVIVFTDGSCIKELKKNICYAGYGVHFPNKELEDISRPFIIKPITNQRAELYAIYVALKKITKHLKFNNIIIYTDSIYSINSLTKWIDSWIKNKWRGSTNKPIKNLDLIKPIYKILKKYPDKIKFYHVRSHTGKLDFISIGNMKADKLATKGANISKKIYFEINKK